MDILIYNKNVYIPENLINALNDANLEVDSDLIEFILDFNGYKSLPDNLSNNEYLDIIIKSINYYDNQLLSIIDILKEDTSENTHEL